MGRRGFTQKTNYARPSSKTKFTTDFLYEFAVLGLTMKLIRDRHKFSDTNGTGRDFNCETQFDLTNSVISRVDFESCAGEITE